MAHYAFLNEHNIVTEVIVGKDEGQDGVDWEQHYGALRKQTCKRTSYNAFAGTHVSGAPGFRKNFAGIGYIYDAQRDAFIPPKPYPSWMLDEECCIWYAPIPKPADSGQGDPPKQYTWDEQTLSWIALEPQPV